MLGMARVIRDTQLTTAGNNTVPLIAVRIDEAKKQSIKISTLLHLRHMACFFPAQANTAYNNDVMRYY